MTRLPWLRDGCTIAAMELRRTIRQVRADRARLWLYMLLAFFMTILSVVLGLGAFVYFRTMPSLIENPTAIDAASRATVVGFWSFWLLVYVSRTLSNEPRIGAEAAVLPATEPRAVLTGLVIAEWLRLLTYLVGPVVIVGAVTAYSLSAPLWFFSIVATTALATLTIALTAYTIALGGAVAVVRYPLLARYRIVVGLMGALLIATPYVLIREAQRGELGFLGIVPVGWYADLFVVGSPILTGSAGRAIGVLLCSGALLCGLGLLAERFAVTYWYGDGFVSEIARSSVASGRTTGLRRRAERLFISLPYTSTPPTRAVLLKTLVLTRRKPGRLAVFVVPIVIVGANLLVTDGAVSVTPLAPVAAAIVCPWLAGVAFGLNPLGDEAAVLPTTLTSSVSGRAFLRGLLLPGGVVGVLTVIPGVVLSGLWLGYGLLEVGLLGLFAVSLTCVSLTLAPAIGIRAPRYDAITARGNDEIVPPSLTAIAVHAVGLGVVFTFGIACWALPEVLTTLFATGPVPGIVRTGQILGVGAASLVSVRFSVLAYRSAIDAFERATID